MRLILSRKGFDSSCGCMPSPIMPDETLLSLPIPSNDDITYSCITWQGKSYLETIHELNPKTAITHAHHCHLDPDLRTEVYHRKEGWMPAFGQTGASLTELHENGVGVGDLFLFFGWFKETEYKNGKLAFKSKSRDLHVIYGYMQIGNIVKSFKDVPEWMLYHPHTGKKYDNLWTRGLNAIFTPSSNLSFNKSLPGAGLFKFDKRYVLTKDGYSRSRWEFPEPMKGTPITHNPRGWKDDYFQSATRGQEFIMECSEPVMSWVNHLFR